MPAIAIETTLRHAVIDRLIAASLRDGKPAREATLERWRLLGRAPETQSQPYPTGITVTGAAR
jgi:hypothetical protein